MVLSAEKYPSTYDAFMKNSETLYIYRLLAIYIELNLHDWHETGNAQAAITEWPGNPGEMEKKIFPLQENWELEGPAHSLRGS